MRKTLVIAIREYLAAVRTKAFVISIVFLPLMMGGGVGISAYLQHLESTKEKIYAVVDRTPGQKISARLKKGAQEYYHNMVLLQDVLGKTGAGSDSGQLLSLPTFQVDVVEPDSDLAAQRADLSEKVRKGRYAGFVDVGADVYEELTPAIVMSVVLKDASDASSELSKLVRDPRELQDRLPDDRIVRFHSKNPAMAPAQAFFQWAQAEINKTVRDQRCEQAKLPVQEVDDVIAPVPLVSKGLTEGEKDASTSSVIAQLIAPMAVVMLMFMMLMVGATPIMQGVVEEKSQRIAEVLLGSIRPFPLMMGKLTGLVGVSLTLSFVYLGAGYWVAHHFGVTKYLSLPLVGWFLLFQALAVLMYGSLFIAIGAACTDLRETQTLMWPVVLLGSIPIFFLNALVEDPNGQLVTTVSFFPPATPMLMVARMAVPPGVPWWQPLVGVCGVLATTLVFVYAAGRIFRVGLLMQGQGARVSDLMRWIVRG